jgi:DNA-binding response OmpR family regulator
LSTEIDPRPDVLAPGFPPAFPPGLAAELSGDDERVGAGDGSRAPGEGPLRTVLVIDDETAIAEALAEFFTAKGYRGLHAGGGLDGLAVAQREQPDVILLDVRMPDLDGIGVLRALQDRRSDASVIVMSGQDDMVTAREAIALGAFDYVLKPFDFEYLERAVGAMVRARIHASPAQDAPPPSAHGLVYDLAVEVFLVTRGLTPEHRGTLAAAIESAALTAAQRSIAGERDEVIGALGQLRMLIRFALDVGDFSDEAHRHLEVSLVRARRSLGLTDSR